MPRHCGSRWQLDTAAVAYARTRRLPIRRARAILAATDPRFKPRNPNTRPTRGPRP